MPLTPSQEAHLTHIQMEFSRHLDKKFRRGADEHGGDLRDNDPIALIDFLIDEITDAVTYGYTLRSMLCVILEREVPVVAEMTGEGPIERLERL